MFARSRSALFAAVLPLAALSGCVAYTGPVEVTRFHRAAEMTVPASGTVAVRAMIEEDRGSLAYTPYLGAVRRELQAIGFSEVAGADQAAYIAEVHVERGRADSFEERSPVSVGVGGRTGSYGSGVGVGIGINLGGSGGGERLFTELLVRIVERESGIAIWEGRAVQGASPTSPAAQPGLAASKLAQALFEGFPGVSGRTITVE